MIRLTQSVVQQLHLRQLSKGVNAALTVYNGLVSENVKTVGGATIE